jgi:ABC-type nitrate/sulfonate/bicarbonate transport system substrate-binding protein
MPDSSPTPATRPQRPGRQFRIGFVPLLDAAPVVAAHWMGFYESAGIATTMLRQPGWACVRDKMRYGELDAAHAPGGFLFAMNTMEGRCLTACITSAQGNAITLSSKMHGRGLRDAGDLAVEVRTRRGEPVTFGIVSPYSTHAHLLRSWLKEGGLDLAKEVRIVILPPQQMVASLAAGHLDGFCAGEPWNSMAVAQGHGWVAASSQQLAPMHPEKALLVHEDFALRQHDDHMAMVNAQKAACAWCGDPKNRPELAKLLAGKVFHDVSPSLLLEALESPLAPVFSAPGLHDPTPEKAAWLLSRMRQHKLLPAKTNDEPLLASFRSDLYAAAEALAKKPKSPKAQPRKATCSQTS